MLPRTACELSVWFLQNLIKMVMAGIKIIEKLSYHWKFGKTLKILPFETPVNASLIDLSSFSSTSF